MRRFRWVSLQLDVLCDCPTSKDIKVTLDSLSHDLDDTYQHIIQRIDGRYRAHVKGFIMWLAFSAHTMRLEEIAETAAVDFTPSTGPVFDFEGRYQDPKDVLEKCSSLVIESDGM